MTAIPEELLFRGLLQNLLRRWTGRPFFSITVGAVLFGLAHLNVGSRSDWRLALLATLAGVAYGWVYEAGGTLMAPALAHTFVNSLWMFLFPR